jgi:hypothetical protein
VVVVEATGNAASVAAVIAPHVIAHAKIKTDTIDASVLAQLYASGFLPEVWIPDEPTQACASTRADRRSPPSDRARASP